MDRFLVLWVKFSWFILNFVSKLMTLDVNILKLDQILSTNEVLILFRCESVKISCVIIYISTCIFPFFICAFLGGLNISPVFYFKIIFIINVFKTN